MVRPLQTATKDALDKPVVPLAAIVYLDILGDPLYAWTGIGDLKFASLVSELVVNGTFDTNVNGWVAGAQGFTQVGGRGRLTNNTGGYANWYQGVPTVIGQKYKLTYTMWPGTGMGQILLGSTNVGASRYDYHNSLAFTPRRDDGLPHEVEFVATTNTAFVSLNNNSGVVGTYAEFDNISIVPVYDGEPATGDSILDGKTFKGVGSVIEVSGIEEGAGGSDSLEISFPGVDPNNDLMKQIIRDRRRWQFRRAVVWMLVLNPDTMAIEGKPFRIKTGRMDAMPYDENSDKSRFKCVIEGQQSYGSEPLNTRYSEQIDIDNTDTSQKWVYALANMSAKIGTKSAGATKAAAGLGGGGLGSILSGSNVGGLLGAILKRLM